MGHKRWTGRGGLALVLLLSGVLLVLAQPTGKQRTEEEEDSKPSPSSNKTPPGPGRTEEEDDVPRRPTRRVIQDPDAMTQPSGKPRSKPAEPQALDLAEAARSTRQPVAQALLQSLAVARDVVLFRGRTVERIQPLPQLVGDKVAKLPRDLELVPLDETGKAGEPFKVGKKAIARIQPYEEAALEAVNKFLADTSYTRLVASDPRYLLRQDQLLVAEQVLGYVARYHESARQRGDREGPDWLEIGGRLLRMPEKDPKQLRGLRDVQLLRLQELVDAGSWDEALTLGRRLSETFPLKEDHLLIADPLARLLKGALDNPLASREKRLEVRQKLAEMQERYKDNPKIQGISDGLKSQAQELVRLAERAQAQKDPGLAQDLLAKAEEVYPQLPELRAKRLAANRDYPILKIGVRQLPKKMSPGWATTDSERRAVELMFESLVRVSIDAEGVQHFVPGLALGRPQAVSLGRIFQMPRNAFWSNNQPLTQADIRYSVERLKLGSGSGRAPAWGDLLEPIEIVDPFRINMNLTQGYLDPMSLMTFKVLPQPFLLKGPAADTEDFSLDPVGSGPFVYAGQRSEGGRKYSAFLANPNYRSRTGKTGLPRIRELRLVQYVDPVEDLKNLKLHMLLDLTPKQMQEIRQQGPELRVTAPSPLAGNRRVYFLAVNHRIRTLQNTNLRRALAHAINREQLLDLCFRGELQREVHKALNGPFPAKSWPLHPTLHNPDNKDSLDPFDRTKAMGLSEEVYKTNDRTIKLTLKYPAGDEAVEKAMEGLSKMVKDHTKVQLILQKPAPDPYTLRREIEEGSYELAYTYYDFPDDTYWLAPLLGPRAGPTGNYLNYSNAVLETQLLRIRGWRDFAQVRKTMRELHRSLWLEMPIIPLWQLDPLLAVRDDLKRTASNGQLSPLVPGIDPWLVFSDIDDWQPPRD